MAFLLQFALMTRAFLSRDDWGSMNVSVIIPCYNYGRFLAEAVDSVLGQTVAGLEIIIVDDGSEDDTPRIGESLTGDHAMIEYIRTENQGPANARNVGMARSRGKYIAFLDADDRWRPNKIECQLKVMESEPSVAMTFSNVGWFRGREASIFGTLFEFIDGLDTLQTRTSSDGSARVITEDPFLALLRLSILAPVPSATILRREAVRRAKWRSGLHPAEDYEYLIRVSRFGAVAFTEEILTEMRRHGNNSYSDESAPMMSWVRAFEKMIEEDGDELTTEYIDALRRKIGRIWCAIGWRHYWKKQPLGAVGAYSRALAYPSVRLNAIKHLLTVPISFLLSKKT